MVFGLKAELQVLKEQSSANNVVNNDEQLEATNAPTGAAPLTNSSASLYLTLGAAAEAEMTGGDTRPPPAIHNMIGQQPCFF